MSHKPYSQRERALYLRLLLSIGGMLFLLLALILSNADRIDGKQTTCPVPADEGQRVVIYAVPDGYGGLKDEVHFQPVGLGGNRERKIP